MNNPVTLHWNGSHELREQLLSNACMQSRLAYYEWDELEEWERELIREQLETRTNLTVTIENKEVQ